MRSFIKHTTIIAAVLLFTGYASTAQKELQLNLGYNVNIPTGSFKNDMVSNPAYKGFTAGLSYSLSKQFSLGLDFSYNDYYQKYPTWVYVDDKGNTISAVLSNSVQQIPLILHADYTLLKTGIIRPYIGAGAGVNFISFDQYLGEFDNPMTFTKLAVRGEAGILIPLSSYSSSAVKIGATYNYAPLNEMGFKNLDTWGIQAGVRFPLH